jgi:ketosteroid isomerase-like protein
LTARDVTDVVRTMYDGFAEGNIARAVSVVHPDVEWIELFPYEGTYRGRDALVALFERVSGDFDRYDMSFDEWVVGSECVAVLGSYRVSRRGRDGVYESRFVHLFWVRDGQVVKYEQVCDRKTAHLVL